MAKIDQFLRDEKVFRWGFNDAVSYTKPEIDALRARLAVIMDNAPCSYIEDASNICAIPKFKHDRTDSGEHIHHEYMLPRWLDVIVREEVPKTMLGDFKPNEP